MQRLGLAISLCIVTTSLIYPTVHATAPGFGGPSANGSPASPDQCTETTSGILTQHVQVADLQDKIVVVCHGGQAIDATTSGGSRTAGVIPIGSSCTAT